MKALTVIACIIVLAFFLKALEYFTGSRNIRSVGSRSNRKSRDIARVDITDKEELEKALEHYKGMVD